MKPKFYVILNEKKKIRNLFQTLIEQKCYKSIYGKCIIKNTNIYKMVLTFYPLFCDKLKFRLVTIINSEIWI